MMKRLWPYLLTYKSKLLLGFLFILLTNLFSIITPQIVRQAIDYYKGEIEVNQLLYFAGLLIGVTLILGIFRFLTRRTIIVVSRLIENDLRNDLFSKLQSLSSAFYQRNSTGDIMARLTNDLTAIRSVLGPGLMYTFNTITIFIFAIIMMLQISPILTLVAMIPVPVMVFVVNRLSMQVNKRFLEVQNQFAAISTKVQENLSGIRIVKSYVREDSEIEDFNRLNQEYINKNMHYVKIYAAFRPVMMLIVGIGIALILLIGGRFIVAGTITLGDFVAFNLYTGMLVWPSIALGWVMSIFYQGVASMERLDHILLEDPDIKDDDETKEISEIYGQISLNHLSFNYPDHSQKVLQDINFEVPAGKILALVGRTGSGKSTVMQLLTRTFDPQPESLYIDNNDVRQIPVQTLRHAIGYVPQESFLFSDTIKNNIAFGMPDASLEAIQQAAEMAQIHEAIEEFPKGYDTMLGERGITLSGGQKQRLALARAILKKPKLLLLDDALSAVDTLTEEVILNNLRTIMEDKTCVWISHRISAIKDADDIIVLDEGKIFEQGTHDELLKLNGLYASLYEKQLLEESLQKAG